MLRLEIKTGIILILLCTLFACKEKKKEKLEQKRALYKEYSVRKVGIPEYISVFKAANDSLRNWTNNHLSGYAVYKENVWYLDSLICFNENIDKCIMALSYQASPSSPSDGIERLYGAKIKERWYFFRGGGVLHLPRELYVSVDSLRYPLSFKHLSEIAMENIYIGYLKQSSKGKWEINDAFFTSQFENEGWGDFENQSHSDTVDNGKRYTNKKEYFESIYLRYSKEKWFYRDTL